MNIEARIANERRVITQLVRFAIANEWEPIYVNQENEELFKVSNINETVERALEVDDSWIVFQCLNTKLTAQARVTLAQVP